MKAKWNGNLEKRACDSLIMAASGQKIYAVDLARQVIGYIDLEKTLQGPVTIEGMDQLDLKRGEPEKLRVAVSRPNRENQAYFFSGNLQTLEELPEIYQEITNRSRTSLRMLDSGLRVEVSAKDGALKYTTQRDEHTVKIPLQGKKFVENYKIK